MWPDCQTWPGAKTKDGYGVVRAGDNIVYVHRRAYEEKHGPIPKGMKIDHRCRNRACFNVEHLEAVTNAVNTRRGDRAKLSVDAVREIRRRYAAGGVFHRELAEEYGVHPSQITRAINGEQWA